MNATFDATQLLTTTADDGDNSTLNKSAKYTRTLSTPNRYARINSANRKGFITEIPPSANKYPRSRTNATASG